MIRRLKSKKGFSLVEMILSITLLAMVTIPVTMGFASISAINMKTRKQIEVNSISRTVQQIVIESVKNGHEIETTTGGTVKLNTLVDGTNLKIINSSGEEDNKYIFDAKNPISSSGTVEYTISIKEKKDNKVIKNFKLIIDIY